MALPPFDGAVHDRETCVSPLVAVGAPGVDGTVAGVTGADGSDVDEPNEFVAVTVNVYAVPLVKPVTTNGDPEPDAVKPPGLDVAVYVAMPVPGVAEGVNATLTCKFPGVPTTPVGAPGFMPAPKPNLRVAPLPMRLINGIGYLMQILIGLQTR